MAKRNQAMAGREGAQLDARLNEYSALARVSATAKSMRNQVGNWPIYAAAAGSALAMATSASANIIHGTYPSANQNPASHASKNASVQPGPSFIKGLTFISFGKDEINIGARSGVQPTFSGGPPQPFAQLYLQGVDPVRIFFTGSLAKNFGAGKRITGSNSGPVAKVVASVATGHPYGNFSSGQPGYAGLKIKTAGGGLDFGWLKLEFTEQSGLPHLLTALAFGIEETPGAPILAGQTSDAVATPEPGSMGLAILAAGAAGVVALRRRRKQTSAT